MSSLFQPAATGRRLGNETLPRWAIRVTSYPHLQAFVQGFAQGHLNLLILLGGPGLGKSQQLRQALAGPVCWLEGNASAFGIYRQLWISHS
jgi:hypothetical protein